jgi:two-component system, LytTR family, response regulator LytT
MNILILEDEKAAAQRMRQLVAEVMPNANILAVIETVKEAVKWLRDSSHTADMILSDIQLADGLSFEVLEQVQVKIPVIFTTAYDAYTLRAFKLNSIDYLLKPVDKEELQAAFDKYKSLQQPANTAIDFSQLLQQLQQGSPAYKSRFLVKQGDRLSHIPATDAAYMRADDKVILLHTTQKQKYIIDETLDELEKVLDPQTFFRINRSYIAHIQSIGRIHTHFNGRLKIELHHCDDTDIFVSRQRVSDFKQWLNR